MDTKPKMGFRMSWADMRRSSDLVGRWVALDNVRVAPGTTEPLEADLIDVDDDLVELCARIRAGERTCCRILQCVDRDRTSSRPPPPVYTH